jgi:4-hydroxy-4-methyl-2-oxoglutarate aldolase
MSDQPTLNPHPPSLAPEVIEAFRQLPPATIGHIVDDGFVDTAIRPIFRRLQVVGTAVTLKLPEGDIALTRPAIELLRPGDVLVIDQGGETRVACWGEMTSLAAKVKGCVGVIVDGAVTDVVEIEDQRMPTFARSVSALVGRRLDTGEGGVNVPAQCGGVAVHPGDLIVADDNGIVVIPPQRVADIATQARAAEDRAPFQRIWLERGGSLADLSGKQAPEIHRMLQERGWL